MRDTLSRHLQTIPELRTEQYLGYLGDVLVDAADGEHAAEIERRFIELTHADLDAERVRWKLAVFWLKTLQRYHYHDSGFVSYAERLQQLEQGGVEAWREYLAERRSTCLCEGVPWKMVEASSVSTVRSEFSWVAGVVRPSQLQRDFAVFVAENLFKILAECGSRPLFAKEFAETV